MLNMRKILSAAVLAAVLFAVYWFVFRKKENKGSNEPTLQAIKLKKHSPEFNAGIDSVVNAYLNIKTAFVDANVDAAKAATQNFIAQLGKLPLEELKKDTLTILQTVEMNVSDLKANAESLLQQTDITEMRRDFSMVTEMIYPSFLTAVKYEGKKLFVAKCPMAFNDNEAANWLSDNAEIINPYLGSNHPKYKAGMLHCGDVVDSIMAK
jgi:hypothetical protein